MFDGVHRGHQHLINQLCRMAAERELTPTVFTFDRHPLEIIDPERTPPIISTPAQRAEYLVDYGVLDVIIMVFNKALREMKDADFLRMLHDDYGVEALLLGYNHRFGHKSTSTFEQYREMGKEAGIEVFISDEYNHDGSDTHISSSMLRRVIASGDIQRAESLLGHPFVVRGRVIEGRGLGHKIGFPTINIQTIKKKKQLLPAIGVYAAEVKLPGGRIRKAMVNIGKNPTVNDTPLMAGNLSANSTNNPDNLYFEAHLLNFKGDLYGAPVEVRFIRRIRDEKKFPSIEALTAALKQDREDVKNGK